jgi:amidophosphoribosyltransferase
MCGIVGIVGQAPVNQEIYDSLLLLQHRGQDSTGIATAEPSGVFHVQGEGQVREAFRTRDMRALLGNVGLGHVRYATKGTASSEEEAQPFYVNAPYGIVLVHNGNLTNTRELTDELAQGPPAPQHERHRAARQRARQRAAGTISASISTRRRSSRPWPARTSASRARTRHRAHRRYGLLAFRDPFGIRPLILGTRDRRGPPGRVDRRERVARAGERRLRVVREVEPGEAVFIDLEGNLHTKQCAADPKLVPCSFEYVYLARPDSIMNGISVYEARLRMGDRLADTIAKYTPKDEIDVVMPIPDSSRPAAMQVARKLGIEYREGFYKNRYVGRTFIMPGQAVRKKSVRQKLNAMSSEFKGKNVLLIDDSIVRGTTSKRSSRWRGMPGRSRSLRVGRAARPHPHVYGINMPSSTSSSPTAARSPRSRRSSARIEWSSRRSTTSRPRSWRDPSSPISI